MMDTTQKTPRKRIPKNIPWRNKVALNRGRGTEKSQKIRTRKHTPKDYSKNGNPQTVWACEKEMGVLSEKRAALVVEINSISDDDKDSSRRLEECLDALREIDQNHKACMDKIYFIEETIERVHAADDAAYKRLTVGYEFDGGYILGGVNGTYHPEFVFQGLISDNDPILELALSKTPRARFMSKRSLEKYGKQTVMSGYQKDVLMPHSRKVVGLDAPMIDWNKTMRGIMRVDLDFSFVNISALIQNINDLGVPTPNLVVMNKPTKSFFTYNKKDECISEMDDFVDETISSCHLYWVLRDSVCFTENGNKRAKKAFTNLLREMTWRLQPIGADMGGLSNPMRGKNPFSPHMTTFVVYREPYWLSGTDCVAADNLKSLAGEMGFCPTYMPKHHKNLLATKDAFKMFDQTCSNSLWSLLVARAGDVVGVWKQLSDHAPSKSQDAFKEFRRTMIDFNDTIVDTITDQALRSKYGSHKFVDKVVNHFWKNHKTKKTTLIPNIEGLSAKERQSINGSRRRASVRLVCLKKLVDGANQLQREMQQDGDDREFISVHDMNKTRLIEITGLSASTCRRRERLRNVDEVRQGIKDIALEGKICDYIWTEEKAEMLIEIAKEQMTQADDNTQLSPKKATKPTSEAASEANMPDKAIRKKGQVCKASKVELENQEGRDKTQPDHTKNINGGAATPFNDNIIPFEPIGWSHLSTKTQRYGKKTVPFFVPTDEKKRISSFRMGTNEQIRELIRNLYENGIKPIETPENMVYTRISIGSTVQECEIERDLSAKRQFIEAEFDKLPKHNMFEFRKNEMKDPFQARQKPFLLKKAA